MTKRTLVVFCILSGAGLGLFGIRGGTASSLAPMRLEPAAKPAGQAPHAATASTSPTTAATKATDASTHVQNEIPNAHALVLQLSEEIGRPDIDFKARERRLRSELNMMGAQDLQTIGLEVGQGRLTGDDARATLYLLSLAGEKAVPALREIALGNGAKATTEGGERFAHSLRVDALEQLEGLAARSAEARRTIFEASTQIEGRSLRELARIASLGLQQGKPGKLHRLMDETLKNHGG